ncbi:hypothetical protein [Embleya sp. NPDC001921]
MRKKRAGSIPGFVTVPGGSSAMAGAADAFVNAGIKDDDKAGTAWDVYGSPLVN